MRGKLTPKQAAFAAEYLVDLNATQAAIRAGYSANSAARIGADLLQKTQVQAAIQSAQAERSKRVDLTADWVVSRLREVAERCMQSVPVTDRKGQQIVIATEDGPALAYTFDSGGANRSLELLGKHLGMFKDAQLEVQKARYVIIGAAEESPDEWLANNPKG